MRLVVRALAVAATMLVFCPHTLAQHLWWDLGGQRDATCLYGTITEQVVDDKGSVSIPNGHFEHQFGSRMSVDLGPEWGDLAGHFERMNKEKLVWVNDGPPTVIHFANVFPREIHVPQTPAPDPFRITSFFDVFTEINLDGSLGPLEPGMNIEEGPDTFLEGASGRLYPGTVTPINDLSLLPTSNANDTLIVWDLSRFATTTGDFFLIEYQLPVADIAGVPEPTTLASCTLGIAILTGLMGLKVGRRKGSVGGWWPSTTTRPGTPISGGLNRSSMSILRRHRAPLWEAEAEGGIGGLIRSRSLGSPHQPMSSAFCKSMGPVHFPACGQLFRLSAPEGYGRSPRSALTRSGDEAQTWIKSQLDQGP